LQLVLDIPLVGGGAVHCRVSPRLAYCVASV
jgi:hypothetical protein